MRSALRPLTAAGALALAGAAFAQSPLQVQKLNESIPGGKNLSGMVASVSLKSPMANIRTTIAPKMENGAKPAGETALSEIAAWAEAQENKVDFAFAFGGFKPLEGNLADLTGLYISGGNTLSQPRASTGAPDYVFAITVTRTAKIFAPKSPSDLDGITFACAAAAPETADGPGGTPIVTAGKNTASTAVPRPDAAEPRAAIGVGKDGKALYFVAVDSTPTSPGATLAQLADVLIGLGAHDAIVVDPPYPELYYNPRGPFKPQTNTNPKGPLPPAAAFFGVKVVADPTANPGRDPNKPGGPKSAIPPTIITDPKPAKEETPKPPAEPAKPAETPKP